MIPLVPTLSLPFQLILRDGWGAQAPLGVEPSCPPFFTIILHYYTGVHPCYNLYQCGRTLRQMQRDHLGQGHADIGYNFLIGNDKKVYEGRGWDARPPNLARFKRYYDKRIDIGFIGDYQGRETNVKRLSRTLSEFINYSFRKQAIVKYYDLHTVREVDKWRKYRRRRFFDFKHRRNSIVNKLY